MSTADDLLQSINDENTKNLTKETMERTGLPADLALAAVRGGADAEKTILKHFAEKHPTDDASIIRALRDRYKEAVAKGDARTMVNLKNRLHELGATVK